ncbi:PREDICTED: uncharacterized protein LOC109477414 [Branchiostoma belcheri]|uniref:Uncharacterized protein LOC109477414 n=1 Tax=Branchiostoma belcheri TaxID=7741 RepID=A0A6P4YY00_BRABE|nr:PREDICTED: uncharacterized protein LOC109477414 [Branchiostoma belcheri]
MLQLEKDMVAAGISFPALVRDIPGVPEELKYTRTTESVVGPTGGELEIPGFVKLVVPPDVLQQDTMITISTVDVAAILRDPESLNWISGYPWSLGEDACPRELLEQVLFSPAVDVNLHGAQLSGPVEVQTWRPPGSEDIRCFLLKHHDGEGWTDITASTQYQINQNEISISLQSFSPVVTGWAPADAVIASVEDRVRRVVDALSSRTLDCRFAAYINPSPDGDVQFRVVCRDQRVQTDEYHSGFTKCGGNAANFDLFHGDELDITVSVRGGQEDSEEMELRSKLCCDKYGQNVQMWLDRPNGRLVKGKVSVKKVQVPTNRTACQFIFKEEGEILQRNYTRDSTTEESDSTQTTPKELVEPVRGKLALSSITGDSETRRVDVLSTYQRQAGPGDRTDSIALTHALDHLALRASSRLVSIARGSGSKPVVLLISDKYGSSYDDVCTTHRQMAVMLVSQGAVIYSTVLDATEEDKRDATADGVRLIFPTRKEGDIRDPCLDWLTYDHESRYPSLPSNVDFIVGHINTTSRAAKLIKKQRLPGAKLVQVTHEIPEETSHYKGDEKVTSIGEESDSILEDLRHADIIFSVGPLIYDYYRNQTKEQQRPHHEFLPKPSDIFSKMQVNYVNTKTKVVLSIGRVKGAESLKGYDISGKAMGMVIEQLPNTRWRACGVTPEDFKESKQVIQANMEKNKFNFTPLKCATQEELSRELQKAHVVLMPSRAEPFGQVGLEAIAAGIPVLVSNKSGLASFLSSQDPEFDRPIVDITDDHEAASTLAKRIIKILKDGRREFQAAQTLKEKLLASKYWDESHRNFLEAFGL